MNTDTNPTPDTPPEKDHPATKSSGWSRFWFAVKVAEVRMRFVAVLVISGALIGYWDVIKNHYDKYTRPAGAVAAAAATATVEYFCPMHTFIVRDHFDKCPICGMDLVKRKKGEKEDLPGGVVARVQVSPLQIAEAGVKTEEVETRVLTRETRVAGQVESSESAQATIANRFPGRVEKLLVNYVGAQVQKGDALAQIYSPEFVAASEEYLLALSSGTSTGGSRVQATRDRLLLAGFTDAQVADLARTRQVPRLLTYFSPIGGTVLEKKAVEGDYVEQGAPLFSVADLSRVWVQARVLEADLADVKVGQPVEVRSVAYPNIVFIGNVGFVYPTVEAESRSVKVRVEVSNRDMLLRPGMYVTALLRAPVGRFEPLEPPDLSHLASAVTTGTPEMAVEAPLTSATLFASRPSGVSTAGSASLQEIEWQEGYTCVMHPETLQEKGGLCNLCDCGMQMTKWRREKVLAVPENAVIDTGTRKFVYVEQAAGVFDARQVVLGARAGSWYSVLSGLKPGMAVATNGSFLIDAENRLNPASEINKPAAETAAAPSEPTVIVKGGYEPEVLTIAAGQPRRIIFDRREEGACTSKVVFPSLGIEKELAPFKKTVLELPTTATGVIDYSCGMDMVHGRIVIGASAEESTASQQQTGHVHSGP